MKAMAALMLAMVVSIITGFDPGISTSVMEKQLLMVPATSGSSHRAFCSSDP